MTENFDAVRAAINVESLVAEWKQLVELESRKRLGPSREERLICLEGVLPLLQAYRDALRASQQDVQELKMALAGCASENRALHKRDAKLSALEAAGVDCWEGFDDAMTPTTEGASHE